MIGGSSTDELIWELQDQVQRGNQMLAWLVSHAGGNPDEIGALPHDDEAAPAENAEAA